MEKEAVSSNVYKIADFVENDLDLVLDIAELIPGLGPIAKILHILVKHREKILLAARLAKKCSSPNLSKNQE